MFGALLRSDVFVSKCSLMLIIGNIIPLFIMDVIANRREISSLPFRDTAIAAKLQTGFQPNSALATPCGSLGRISSMTPSIPVSPIAAG